jgi:prevent-host-death family protein
MPVFNVHASKDHFSKLIEHVISGEEVVIAKAGRPVARKENNPSLSV